jgi:hypothetical protein
MKQQKRSFQCISNYFNVTNIMIKYIETGLLFNSNIKEYKDILDKEFSIQSNSHIIYTQQGIHYNEYKYINDENINFSLINVIKETINIYNNIKSIRNNLSLTPILIWRETSPQVNNKYINSN